MNEPNFQTSSVFNNHKDGIWGKIGKGGGCEVHYIQTVLHTSDLNKLKIISEIKESEKWPIQDLFQRNVNKERVEKGLIPYLKDESEIKFFNPLTLLLLPVDENREIISEIPFLEVQDTLTFNLAATSYTFEDHFSIELTNDSSGSFGKVEWNDTKCYLVAIDGQHRLSALKKLFETNPTIMGDWKVPAQIVCIHKTSRVTNAPRLIDAVRRIFVSINDKAQKLSTARKILLNDILPLDVATQSIIDYSHKMNNDQTLPLFLLNWRGDTTEGDSKLSLLGIQEINYILNEYFDFADEEDLKKPNRRVVPAFLTGLGINRSGLDYKTNQQLREKLKEDFVPGFHKLLRSILVLNSYIDSINKVKVEAENENRSEVLWAFEKEMYGEPSVYDNAGDRFYQQWDGKISIFKDSLPELLKRDIGFRAIFYTYSEIKKLEPFKSTFTWVSLAEYFSPLLNEIIKEGWLKGPSIQNDKNKKVLLINLVYDSSDKIINYRINDVPKALGAFLSLQIISKLLGKDTFRGNSQMINFREEQLNTIKESYERDIRKEVRADISLGYTGTPEELKKEIKKKADQQAKKKQDKLEQFFTI